MDVSFKYSLCGEMQGREGRRRWFLSLVGELRVWTQISGFSYNQFFDPGQSFAFMRGGKCCGEEEG